MLNKTIVATICVTIITIVMLVMKADPYFIYGALILIATLNGVSIWKANHKP